MTEIRDFRDMVNEEISFKDARAISLDLLNRLSYSQAIMRGDYVFESNSNNIIDSEVDGTKLSVSVKESFNVMFWYETYDKENRVDITFEIDMETYYIYYAKGNNEIGVEYYNTRDIINVQNPKLVSLKLNGSEFKLDNKTRNMAINSLVSAKLHIKSKRALSEMKETIQKKIKIPSKEEVLKFPKVSNDIEKAKSNFAKAQEKELKQKNKVEFELQSLEAKIAKKEKVQASRVAAASENTYIVYSKEGFNKQDARILAHSYDCETWAIDRGYREAQDRNERIIKQMAEFGNGTFYYVTHPGGNRSEMEIRF